MPDMVSTLATHMVGHQRKADMGGKKKHRMVMFRAKSKQKAIGAKIAKLRREGKPAKQAAAIAYNMARAGRLGPSGGYKRASR